MLTKVQAKILDALIVMDKTSTLFTYEGLIAATQISDSRSLARACQALNDDGYLETFSMNILGEVAFICLSDKGTNYKEYRRLLRHEQWFASVWLPVIVAFVTTLLTKYALPELWRWLASLLQGPTQLP